MKTKNILIILFILSDLKKSHRFQTEFLERIRP